MNAEKNAEIALLNAFRIGFSSPLLCNSESCVYKSQHIAKIKGKLNFQYEMRKAKLFDQYVPARDHSLAQLLKSSVCINICISSVTPISPILNPQPAFVPSSTGIYLLLARHLFNPAEYTIKVRGDIIQGYRGNYTGLLRTSL